MCKNATMAPTKSRPYVNLGNQKKAYVVPSSDTKVFPMLKLLTLQGKQVVHLTMALSFLEKSKPMLFVYWIL